MEEKQNWTSERPRIENARKVRGIFCIDPEDKEFAHIIKNARKMEVQTVPAMPCKRANFRNGVTCIQKYDHKSR